MKKARMRARSTSSMLRRSVDAERSSVVPAAMEVARCSWAPIRVVVPLDTERRPRPLALGKRVTQIIARPRRPRRSLTCSLFGSPDGTSRESPGGRKDFGDSASSSDARDQQNSGCRSGRQAEMIYYSPVDADGSGHPRHPADPPRRRICRPSASCLGRRQAKESQSRVRRSSASRRDWRRQFIIEARVHRPESGSRWCWRSLLRTTDLSEHCRGAAVVARTPQLSSPVG